MCDFLNSDFEKKRDALRAPPPRSKVRRTEDAGGCSGRVIPFMSTLVPARRLDERQEALEFVGTHGVLIDGPVVEGISFALFHFGKHSRYGLRKVRVEEAFHLAPWDLRESTDDELPLVRIGTISPRVLGPETSPVLSQRLK